MISVATSESTASRATRANRTACDKISEHRAASFATTATPSVATW